MSNIINDENINKKEQKEFVYTVTRSYQTPDGHIKTKTFEYYGDEAQELIKKMKEREELKQLNINSSEIKSPNSNTSEIMLKKFEKNFNSFNDPDLWLNDDLRKLLDSANKQLNQTKTINFISSSNNVAKKKKSGNNSSSSSSSSRQKVPFVKEALDEHNRIRHLHGVHELKLNKDLCSVAQKWAETIAETGAFEHSNNKYLNQSLGENIAMRYTSTGDELTGKQMTDQWYEESSTYDFDKDFQTGKGHFAQIVWKNTLEVGFGRAKSKDGKWYAVANYFPAGNYIGQFRQNVFSKKTI